MGSKQAFSLLNEESLSVTLDMAGVKEGRQEILIGNNNIQYPSNLTVVSINPNKIKFTAHMLRNIDVPVKANLQGALSKGLRIRKITVSPSSVWVKIDPKDKETVNILTEPVDLGKITTTTKLTLQLVVPPEVLFSGGKQPSAEVIIEVEPKGTPLPKKR
jgi:YbbR domain-containing protein